MNSQTNRKTNEMPNCTKRAAESAEYISGMRHVLKPETTKRNHRNERNETTETTETSETTETTETAETKPPKRPKRAKL